MYRYSWLSGILATRAEQSISFCSSRIFRGLLPTLLGVMSTATSVGIYETLREVSYYSLLQG